MMITDIVLHVIDCLPIPSQPFSTLVLAKHFIAMIPLIYVFIRYFEKWLRMKGGEGQRISGSIYENKDVLQQPKPSRAFGKSEVTYLPIKARIPLVVKLFIFILILAFILFPLNAVLDPYGAWVFF